MSLCHAFVFVTDAAACIAIEACNGRTMLRHLTSAVAIAVAMPRDAQHALCSMHAGIPFVTGSAIPIPVAMPCRPSCTSGLAPMPLLRAVNWC